MLSLELIVVLFLIGFVGSFFSGMVGIGGSVIKYPMLLYIPPLLGIGTYSASEVAGISAIQVFFAALGGVWAFRKGGYLNKQLVLTMGIAVLIGSFIGGFGSDYLSDNSINVIYAFMASAAAIMMFVPNKESNESLNDELEFNKILVVLSTFIVGIGAGIVGASGAFLLVPIMLVVFKIPLRITIASSLAVTLLSSIGSTVGKIITDQILYGPAIIMIVASLIAAPLGANYGKKVNGEVLKAILAVIIFITAIKIWFEVLV